MDVRFAHDHQAETTAGKPAVVARDMSISQSLAPCRRIWVPHKTFREDELSPLGTDRPLAADEGVLLSRRDA